MLASALPTDLSQRGGPRRDALPRARGPELRGDTAESIRPNIVETARSAHPHRLRHRHDGATQYLRAAVLSAGHRNGRAAAESGRSCRNARSAARRRLRRLPDLRRSPAHPGGMATGRAGLWDYLELALRRPTSALLVSGERSLAAEFPAEAQARTVLGAIGHGERTFTLIGRAAGGLNPSSVSRSLGPTRSRAALFHGRLGPLAARPDRPVTILDPLALSYWGPETPAAPGGLKCFSNAPCWP